MNRVAIDFAAVWAAATRSAIVDNRFRSFFGVIHAQ